MESQDCNSKKLKRLESKKRKIKAFLELAESNEVDRKSRKLSETLENKNESQKGNSEIKRLDEAELQALKEKFRLRREKKKAIPMFFLTDDGRNAAFHVNCLTKGAEFTHSPAPLFVQDLQHFLMLSMLGSSNQNFPTRWCRLLKHQHVSKVITIIVKGLSSNEFSDYQDNLTNIRNIFIETLEFLPPENYKMSFAEEISYLPLGTGQYMKLQRGFGRPKHVLNFLFPVAGGSDKKTEDSTTDKTTDTALEQDTDDSFSRVDLLLSTMQMLIENYPLPCSNIENTSDYRYTKDVYQPVTAKSPMFSVDCEMCLTEIGKNEVTKVAIVDEKLNTVYETFVKPRNRIINYLTKFSGITKENLVSVTTRLSDVQRHISTFLPADAILVGQSLNMDLHALKMIHPYIIDTSVIFNLTGERRKKSSLKTLSQSLLDEAIQQGSFGHCPVEDSAAAMKLVLAKLKNGLSYGDVIFGGSIVQKPEPIEVQKPETKEGILNGTSTKKPKPMDEVLQKPTISLGKGARNATGIALSFFHKLIDSDKKVCLIGKPDLLDEYPAQALPEEVTVIKKPTNKSVMPNCLENINSDEHNLLLCHIDCSDEEKERRFKKLDKFVKSVFDEAPEKACIVLVGLPTDVNQVDSPSFEQIDNFKRKYGMCAVQLKLPK